MILIDPRHGSGELLPYFRQLKVPVELSNTEMPAGDFAFEGNSEEGRILIGVERKTVKDMMNSIRLERFSGHQLKELMDLYKRWYVIVEGIHRCGADGILEEPYKGVWRPVQTGTIRYMYSRLDNFINSIEETTPVRFKFTHNPQLTAIQVVNLYNFWDKDYSDHKAADGVHHAPRVEIGRKWTFPRIVAAELPGIGADSALAVARKFGTIFEMTTATVEEWAEVEVPNGRKTKRIGHKTAQRIMERIFEEEK